MNLHTLLQRLVAGELSIAEAEEYLKSYGLAEVGLHRLDLHRGERAAVPEVVFGLGKSLDQLVEIVAEYLRLELPLLITKLDEEKGARLLAMAPDARYDADAQLFVRLKSEHAVAGKVAVVSAGSSDQPIAQEAAGTLEFFGVTVQRVFDSGVAGLHRLLASGEQLRDADVIIVVAGMDGALPSVVGGLFRQPLIAVPTSVGYGASFSGLAALLTMLNSCSPGLSVVNIDNGFGAAVAAIAILRLAARHRQQNAIEMNIGGTT